MTNIDKIQQLSVVMAHQLADYDTGLAITALLMAAISLEATEGVRDMAPQDAADMVGIRLERLKAVL
jgi:hypothetical protein